MWALRAFMSAWQMHIIIISSKIAIGRLKTASAYGCIWNNKTHFPVQLIITTTIFNELIRSAGTRLLSATATPPPPHPQPTAPTHLMSLRILTTMCTSNEPLRKAKKGTSPPPPPPPHTHTHAAADWACQATRSLPQHEQTKRSPIPCSQGLLSGGKPVLHGFSPALKEQPRRTSFNRKF